MLLYCSQRILLLLILVNTAKSFKNDDLDGNYYTQDLVQPDDKDDNVYDDVDSENGYLDYDYDYTQDYMNLTFSVEKQKEFYLCLCLGAYHECNILYQSDKQNWNVYSVQKVSSFYSGNDRCKYYKCSHKSDVSTVTCVQQELKSEVCSQTRSPQFFQEKYYGCCPNVCVGILWSNAEDHWTFLHNASSFQSCNDNCQCSADLQTTSGADSTHSVSEGISSTKHITNQTSDKFMQSTVDSDRRTSKYTNTTSSTPTHHSGQSPTNPNEEKKTVENMTDLGRPNSYNATGERTIIISALVAIVTAIVVAACILIAICLCRRRKRGSMKLDSSKYPIVSGTASVSKTGQSLTRGALPGGGSGQPTPSFQYNDDTFSSLPKQQTSPISHDSHTNGINKRDQKPVHSRRRSFLPEEDDQAELPAIGNRQKSGKEKNGRFVEEDGARNRYKEQDCGGVKDRSKVQERQRTNHQDDAEKRGLINQGNKSSVFNTENKSRALNIENSDVGNVESRQPLLTFTDVKESLV